jgi:hypothetical protein
MDAQVRAGHTGGHIDAVPPVQFGHRTDVARIEPGLQAERHENAGLLACRDQARDRRIAQVVVVVVGDQDEVDRRQFARHQRRGHHARRTKAAVRPREAGQGRIGQDVQTGHL